VWNTYPSTNRSSLVLFASHLLLLIDVFFGYPTGIPRRRVAFKKVLVETEPERVTVIATGDDSDTDSAQEYGDASDGMSTPTRARVPGAGRESRECFDWGDHLEGNFSPQPGYENHRLECAGHDGLGRFVAIAICCVCLSQGYTYRSCCSFFTWTLNYAVSLCPCLLTPFFSS
jgi:hypothetical protein